jgi:Tfp pilus assembly protein PilN
MIRINLLKPETKEFKEAPPSGMPEFKPKKAPSLGNLILLLLIIGLAAMFFSQKKEMDKEQGRLSQARQEKESLQYVTAKLAEVEKQKATLEQKISLISQLKAQQDIPVRLMDELSGTLPEWVWLTEASYDNNNVQIKGKALSNNLIADYILNLENSVYLANVNLISSTQRTRGKDEYLEFSLSASVINPEAPPPPPPTPKKAPAKRGKR